MLAGLMPQRKRKWFWWIGGIVLAMALVLIVGQPLLAGFVKKKLILTVETRTNATLKVGKLSYLPLYGVRVEDAEFLVPERQGSGELEMIKVKRIELKLARLPLWSGPLMIQRVTIDSPVVHLVKNKQGLVGISGVMEAKNKVETAKKKLSEIFELRHLAINDAEVEYEDRTAKGSLPVVWKNLNINTETQPESGGAIYSYDFKGNSGEMASVKSTGKVDIDQLILNATSLALKAEVGKGEKESSVPAPVQKLLARYGVSGKLKIDGHGKVPLKHLEQATYQFDVALDDGQGRVPKFERTIDHLTAHVRVTGGDKESVSTLLALEARSGPDVLHVDDGQLAVDLEKKSWDLKRVDLRLDAKAVGVKPFEKSTSAPATRKSLDAGGRIELTAAGNGPLETMSMRQFLDQAKFDVIASATDFHTQPPGFKAPIWLVTGAPIIANQDVVRISNLTGRYGEDQFQLTTLRVPLKYLPRMVRVEEMSASATFDRNTPEYPGKIGNWVKKVRPEGPFELGGTATLNREGSPKLLYHLLVHSDRGAIEYALGDRSVPVTRINMDALVEPDKAQLDYFQANVFGGVVSATGSAALGKEIQWQAKGTVRDFDLRDSVQTLTGKKFDTEKLAGRAFLRFDMAGGKNPESFKGSGAARLFNGKLFEIPILSDILGKAGLGKGLVGSEAAAKFDIADAKVRLNQMALGSPAIGVEGHGTIGFNKTLDLDVVVAPLGQWKDRFKQTGIPIVSKAIGEVAGAVQGAVNAAASSLLYEFHVSGTGEAPKITPVPAPFLTKNGAAIFTKMLGGGEKETTLADEVEKTSDQPAQ